jgi:hypothetical protein
VTKHLLGPGVNSGMSGSGTIEGCQVQALAAVCQVLAL